MLLWLLLIVGIVGAMALAVRWGRPGAVLGWIGGWVGVVALWIFALVSGDDGGWAFTIIVMIGGGFWTVLGAVAAASGLSLRAILRGEDHLPPGP